MLTFAFYKLKSCYPSLAFFEPCFRVELLHGFYFIFNLLLYNPDVCNYGLLYYCYTVTTTPCISFVSCCIYHLTPPLILYFLYITCNGAVVLYHMWCMYCNCPWQCVITYVYSQVATNLSLNVHALTYIRM